MVWSWKRTVEVLRLVWCGGLLIHASDSLAAAELRVAVASNFAVPMEAIADAFERETGDKVVLAFGSTGKHYAQIRQGAPFDLFLAADTERPELLVQSGIVQPHHRFTYAIGQLVLWSADTELVDAEGRILFTNDFNYLAMANPRHAPYGRAAEEVLNALERWETLRPKLVRGENVSQAMHFVLSGNADLGFVAMSQVMEVEGVNRGSRWIPDPMLHAPIEQEVVLLNDEPGSRRLFEFLRSEKARAIILSHGYRLP